VMLWTVALRCTTYFTYSNTLNTSNSNTDLQMLRKLSNEVLSLFCHAASHSCSYGYVRQVTTIAELAQSTQAYALVTHSRWQRLFYQAAASMKVRGVYILCNCNFAAPVVATKFTKVSMDGPLVEIGGTGRKNRQIFSLTFQWALYSRAMT
jgi:hypothetical protein